METENRESYQYRISRREALSRWLSEAAKKEVKQEVDQANFQVNTVKNYLADVSSVGPSSEQKFGIFRCHDSLLDRTFQGLKGPLGQDCTRPSKKKEIMIFKLYYGNMCE